MPPLKEEKTPAPTPAGTISKSQELSLPVGGEGLLAVRKSPRAQAVGLPGVERGYKKVEGVYRVGELSGSVLREEMDSLCCVILCRPEHGAYPTV